MKDSTTWESSDFPEELAFLIGHKDGIIKDNEITPIKHHSNKFDSLADVNDKVSFTQNMQGMQ
jgi:hypothetical protein